ncbi:MAG: hypothetical protein WBH56_10685, partial [Bacteroidota bacterium]
MRRLKSRMSCLALLFMFGQAALAGSFTVIVADTALSDTLGSEVIYNMRVANVSGSDLTLAMVRTQNNLPQDWQSSLCLDLCYSPFVDSVATSAAFGSSPIRAGDTADVSVHVFPLTNPGTGVIQVVLQDAANPTDQQQFRFTTDAIATSVGTDNGIAQKFSLEQNYPNPWNPTTTIRFRVERAGFVSLKLYDTLGREVKVLVHERKPPGEYAVDLDEGGLASGV